jgi:hypothetical protein
MGQHIPDRLFWAREDDESESETAPRGEPASDDGDERDT